MHYRKKVMKNVFIRLLIILCTVQLCHSQAWMTDLGIAQKLASVEDKMVLMVWEETTKYPYPVFVSDDKGRNVFIENLFEDENLSPLIWKYFVPVIVNEVEYADLYEAIEGKRSQNYIDKFNDDSIKIMDTNGNILNVSDFTDNYENITRLILTYALDTAYISTEMKNYSNDKNFYSAYYLTAKYIDFAMYASKTVRPLLIKLSTIYLNEAKALAAKESADEPLVLLQRCELLDIQQDLILKKPKKVLRQLKRMGASEIENNNEPLIAFLYYTTYRITKDEKNAELWKSKVSLVNLKKAQLIINLNS